MMGSTMKQFYQRYFSATQDASWLARLMAGRQQKMLEEIINVLTTKEITRYRKKKGYEEGNSVVVQMPTGTGKTYVMAAVVKWFLDNHDTGEVWIVAHRRELVEQMQQTLDRFCLDYGEKETVLKAKVRIRVLSIQWLGRHIGDLKKADCIPGMIVVDEAHHALARSYKDLFDRNRDALKLGMTATPNRGDKKGLRPIFSNVADQITVKELIASGHFGWNRIIKAMPHMVTDPGGVLIKIGQGASWLEILAGTENMSSGELDKLRAETVRRALAAHPGEVLSKAFLYQQVLHRPFSAHDRVLDMHVSHIRRKLQAIGYLAGPDGIAPLKPLFVDLFKGALALFLLEMGLITASQMGSLRRHGLFILLFGTLIPLLGAFVGGLLALELEFSLGGTMLLATLAASASYIAVPAAMRMAVPEANPGLSLAASLGVTFPFNVLVGIPMYLTWAQWLHQAGG